MPRVVDYAEVLQTATAAGLRCAYPNGAAFVLNTDPAHVAGWSAAAEDATIVPHLRPRVVTVPAGALAALAGRAWRELFPAASQAWLAPVHHWAAELRHGDGEWLGPLLADLGIDPAKLRDRTSADALAFDAGERAAFERTLAQLVANLWKSDFSLLLPGEPAVCTVHHHRQLWWQCGEADDATALLNMAIRPARASRQAGDG